MRPTAVGSNQVTLLLFRLLAAVVLIAYLYLEGDASYQLSMFGIAMLVWIGNYYWKNLTLLFLFSVFLLNMSALYALKYGFPATSILGACSVIYLGLRYLASPYAFTLKRHCVVALLMVEAVLLGSYLTIGLFAYAAFATAIGTLDIYYHGPLPSISWKRYKKYGIVSLFGAARGRRPAKKV